MEDTFNPKSINTPTPKLRNNVSSWRIVRIILVILGTGMCAVLAGTTNALDIIAKNMADGLEVSSSTKTAMQSISLIGLYFCLPVGYLIDKFGTFKVATVSCIVHALCILSLSYLQPTGTGSSVLAFLLLGVAGFGAGGAFIGALTTSILSSPTGGGFLVAVPSAAMSLSVFSLANITTFYNDRIDCDLNGDAPGCWRYDLRLWAVLIGAIQLPGCLLLAFFEKKDHAHLDNVKSAPKETSPPKEEFATPNYESAPLLERTASDNLENDDTEVSLLESLKILKDAYFWVLFFAFHCGIGASVFVLTSMSTIVESYDPHGTLPSYADFRKALMIFSLSTATTNVVSGLLCDVLQKKKLLQSPGTLIAIVDVIAGVNFAILGGILIAGNVAISPAFVFALSIGGGMLFGCQLQLMPTTIGQVYGFANFGKYFAFLQFGSTSGSLIWPIVAQRVHEGNQRYGLGAFFVGAAVLLVIASITIYFGVRFRKKNAFVTL